MIINSLLDSDWYKFTMGQVVFHQFKEAQAVYQFINRGKSAFPAGFASALSQQLDHIATLRLTTSEADWLKNHGVLKPDYIQYLSNFRFNPAQIAINQGETALEIKIAGPWVETILWEVPLMAMVSELFYQMQGKEPATPESYTKPGIKARLMSQEGVQWADFGTRRRFSYFMQDQVVSAMKGVSGFLGTSNPHLAMVHNVAPIGTYAHEAIMAMQAKYSAPEANKKWMEHWVEEYKDKLLIALTDTLTTEVFLKNFRHGTANRFAGVRQDSGSPEDFGEMMVNHYKSLGIDPANKTIIFSDKLDPQRAIDLHKRFSGRIKVSFGIGTNLTADCGHEPMNMVIKLIAADFGDGMKSVVKLSDDVGKHTGSPEAIAAVKKELGI